MRAHTDGMAVRPLEFKASRRLPVGFTMTKPDGVNTHVAVCEVWTKPAGWELRLIMDGHGLPVTTVVVFRRNPNLNRVVESRVTGNRLEVAEGSVGS